MSPPSINQVIENTNAMLKNTPPNREELQTDLEVKIKTGQLNRREKRCIKHKLKKENKRDRVALARALAAHGIE